MRFTKATIKAIAKKIGINNDLMKIYSERGGFYRIEEADGVDIEIYNREAARFLRVLKQISGVKIISRKTGYGSLYFIVASESSGAYYSYTNALIARNMD